MPSLRRKQLRPLSRALVDKLVDHPLTQTWRASISTAAQVAAFGVIGAAIGFCVLFIYGVQRNAMPEFGGDEGLPQFVKLGLFCGVLVALLTIAPAADTWVHRSTLFPRDTASSQTIAPAHHWHYAARQAVLLLLLGTMFSALVLFGDRLQLGPERPLLLIGLTLLVGALGYPLAHYALRSAQSPAPGRPWYVAGLMSVAPHLTYLCVLLAFLLMLTERFGPSTETQALGMATGVVVLLVAVQVVFVALHAMKQVRARLIIAAGFTLMVAGAFAPEVVRMASLGNLPNARLAIERPLGCLIAEHLQLDKHALCDAKPDNPGELASLAVDIVLRVGSQYTVTAPGTLLSRPNDTCAAVLHAPAGVSVARDARRFACVDIPREAVKLSLR